MPETLLNRPDLISIGLILLAVVASAGLGWLLRDRRSREAEYHLRQIQEEKQRQDTELQALHARCQSLQDALEDSGRQREALSVDIARTGERLSQNQEHLQQQIEQQQELQNQLTRLRSRKQELTAALATEQEARQQEQRTSAEKLTLLQEAREQLLKEFENLSQKIFEQKTRQFSEQSQQGINGLLTPFREQLDGLKKKVEEVYVSDVRDRATLKAQITELQQLNQQMSAEAHALTTALRGEKKTQGNWGELVLETVLEKSGLREGIEFIREQQLQNDEGRRFRPDVVINLPDDKHIVVDSKVSLNAYTDYVNCEDSDRRSALGRAHTEAVRQHIRSLSDKAYHQLEGINSPDFVFLFMPVEPAFMLAFQQDESLFNEAFERRIVVVTPTTLLATLRTVANIWAIERRNRSTEKLAEQAGKIYDKLVIVVDRFEKVGSQLSTVQKSYDEAWNSLRSGRGNLVKQADDFRKLGVRVKKELSRTLVEDAEAEHELESATVNEAQLPLMDDN